MKLRKRVSSPLLDPESAKPVYKDFRKTWVDVQRYYLKHYARAVIVTAITSFHQIPMDAPEGRRPSPGTELSEGKAFRQETRV